MWRVSPMNPANNVDGLGPSAKEDVLTLDKSGGLQPVQEALARRMGEAVSGFDNVIIEICNEPYAKNVPANWQRHLATVVQETVAKLPAPVLISENVANYAERIVDPHSALSVFNFHYATPPDAVALNAHLGKVIGDNETGFRGVEDAPYRMEAWEFILAGGGAFNHLDYSFTVGHEDGTFRFPSTQPGGGGPAIRRQLRVLRDFVLGFDFVRMKPDTGFLREGVPASGSAQALVDPGRSYALYLRRLAAGGAFSARRTGTRGPLERQVDDGGAALVVDLPAGSWRVTWLDPVSGQVLKEHASTPHAGGALRLEAPDWTDDVAMAIRRVDVR